MDLLSDRLIIKPLSINDLTGMIDNNKNTNKLNELELSNTQVKAINIKISKMKEIDRKFHSWYT